MKVYFKFLISCLFNSFTLLCLYFANADIAAWNNWQFLVINLHEKIIIFQVYHGLICMQLS